MNNRFPALWGPKYWFVIHYTAIRLDTWCEMAHVQAGGEKGAANDLALTRKRQRSYEFLRDLDVFLPCDGCVLHFQMFASANPLAPLDTPFEPNRYFHWTVDLHNHANKQTGKRTYTHEEAAEWFHTLLNPTTVQELTDAQRARREDAQRIQELDDSVRERDRTVARLTYTLTFVSVILLVIVLGLVASLFIRQRRQAASASAVGQG